MFRQAGHLYEFGPFSLNAQERQLMQDGRSVPLASKTFEALLLLVQNAGHLVTKDDLIRELWSDTFVEEANLAKHISLLRKALGGNGNGQEYIETVPKYGYRFVVAVRERDGVAVPEETTPRATEGLGVVKKRPPVVARRWKYLFAAGLLVILTGSFGVRRWVSTGRLLRLESMQIMKLTDNGGVTDVTISPDGRSVVYARRDGEKEGLWIRALASRDDVAILPPENVSFHGLTFSPDGNFVYFVRADSNDPFFKYLYVMPTLGGPARKLFTDVDSPVSFSPDGRKFAYERCVPVDNRIDIRIANADGSGDRILAAIQNSSCFMYQSGIGWSPDGQTLATPLRHFGHPGRWVLHAVSVAGGSDRELYSTPSDLGRPVWSPDGDALLLPHWDSAEHRRQLWTISYPGGKARRLTNDLNDYNTPLGMTRNGDTLAAIASAGIANVWTFPGADATYGRQITSGNLFMFDVAPAPDGRILSSSVDGTVWVTAADGGERSMFGAVSDARWLTPCGRYLVLASVGPGVVTLMRVNSDGSNPVKLAYGSLWSPACSPDGRLVFYVTEDSPQKIWRVPIDGGTPMKIAEILGDEISGRLSVSPNGQLIAYPYDRYTSPAGPGWSVVVIPVGGGPPLWSFNVPTGFSGARWSPRGEGLQYMLTRDGTTNIWEQPLAGGEPKQLTKFTSGKIFDFNWTADGKNLLVSRGEVTSDVVLLNNLH
jgi:DNA-binding winged helix-turn-helix (wHTH) protein/Tol biopolymer transport system component